MISSSPSRNARRGHLSPPRSWSSWMYVSHDTPCMTTTLSSDATCMSSTLAWLTRMIGGVLSVAVVDRRHERLVRRCIIVIDEQRHHAQHLERREPSGIEPHGLGQRHPDLTRDGDDDHEQRVAGLVDQRALQLAEFR